MMRDVRMIQRGERLRLTLEACQPIGIVGNDVGQHLDRDLPPRFVSVARYTSPIPPTPIWAVISYGPRRVPGFNDTAVGWNCRDYTRMRESRG